MHEWRASRHWLGQKITPEYTCCPVMSAYDLSFVRGRSYQTLLTQLLFLKCNWCMRTNHLITIFFLVGWTRRKKRRNRLAHWDDGPNKNRFSCCRFSIIIYFAGFFFRLVKKTSNRIKSRGKWALTLLCQLFSRLHDMFFPVFALTL